MNYLTQNNVQNKRVLLRVDFNVSLSPTHTVVDDARIRQALPTIKLLLQNGNKVIIVSHLDRPKFRDPSMSLRPVCDTLQSHLPEHNVVLVDDFLTNAAVFSGQTGKQILVLENIRFYKEEQANDEGFAQKLAALGDVFVSDCFSVAHRRDASIVSLPKFLPSYAGLLMKKEVEMLDLVVKNPKHPLVAILGGSKISTKLQLIGKFLSIADTILIGGGLANNFLKAQGNSIGKSIFEESQEAEATRILEEARKNNVSLLLPTDVVVGSKDSEGPCETKAASSLTQDDTILDIGIKTRAVFTSAIAKAATIIWNGPVGYFENPHFRLGTDAVCDAVITNTTATSVIGGGDTLAAISHRHDLDPITHISTAGGAMLEYIENGTLPGIEALKM